jgi:hypothetical protein
MENVIVTIDQHDEPYDGCGIHFWNIFSFFFPLFVVSFGMKIFVEKHTILCDNWSSIAGVTGVFVFSIIILTYILHNCKRYVKHNTRYTPTQLSSIIASIVFICCIIVAFVYDVILIVVYYQDDYTKINFVLVSLMYLRETGFVTSIPLIVMYFADKIERVFRLHKV